MKKKIKGEYKYLKKEYSYVFGMMVFFTSTFFLVFDYIINKKLNDFYFETLELETYSFLGVTFVFMMFILFFIPSERKIKFIFFNTIFFSAIFMAMLIFGKLFIIAYSTVSNEITRTHQDYYFESLGYIGGTIIIIFLVLFVSSKVVSKKNR